jgi:hypothetical protein
LADEAVTDAWDGGDPLATRRRGTEELAQRSNLNREVAFLDSRSRPRRVHELSLGAHLTGVHRQRREKQGGLLSDGNQLPVTEERSVIGIEQKWSEGDRMP